MNCCWEEETEKDLKGASAAAGEEKQSSPAFCDDDDGDCMPLCPLPPSDNDPAYCSAKPYRYLVFAAVDFVLPPPPEEDEEDVEEGDNPVEGGGGESP